MRRCVGLMLLLSTVAWGKQDCKAKCGGVRAMCAKACDSAKDKKGKKACLSQGCEMAVTQCEGSCKDSNAKRH